MAMFSAEMALPRPSGRWELSVMVELQGGHEKAVRRGGCEEEPEPNTYERASYGPVWCRE